MINVQVTCDTGKKWTTGINATIEDARAYYIGSDFVDEDDNGKETHNIAVSVEEV